MYCIHFHIELKINENNKKPKAQVEDDTRVREKMKKINKDAR